MSESKRVLIMGLDGATWDILDRLMDQGIMPNLAAVRKSGSSCILKSVIPTITAAAWVSFMTGKLPNKHGVWGFRNPSNHYNRVLVDSSTVQSETLWEILSRNGVKVGIMNMPMTYPPYAVNGFLISGLGTPDLDSIFTYPADLRDGLINAVSEYVLDVNWENYKGRIRELVEDLIHMNRVHTDATIYALRRFSPDVLGIVLVATDRFQHALWRLIDTKHPKYNKDEANKYGELVQRFYKSVDVAIGRIMEGFGDFDGIFVVSDHGFGPARVKFNIDNWLAEKGLLRYNKSGRLSNSLRHLIGNYLPVFKGLFKLYKNIRAGTVSEFKKQAIDWENTYAYCPWDQPQAININLRGRESKGIVSPKDYEKLRMKIARKLMELREPISNTQVVRKVYFKEDFGARNLWDPGPDIWIELGDIGTAPARSRSVFEELNWMSGDHNLNGIFLASGKNIRKGVRLEGIRLIDVAPTILYYVGVPIPKDVDGRIAEQILEKGFLEKNRPKFESGLQGIKSSLSNGEMHTLSPEDQRKIEERLRGLGYL